MPRRELAGKPSDARAQMWRAIRMTRRFSVRDLLALTGVRRKAAEKFLLPLVRANYLRVQGAGPARCYFVIKDTGPIPPRIIGRSGVLDLNMEVGAMRARHAELVREIRAVEKRIARYGAYIEKYQTQSPTSTAKISPSRGKANERI